MMTLPDRLQLPFTAAIMAEAAAFPQSRWERHFNTQYYEGEWGGITLRSTGGLLALYSDPNGTFSDKPDSARCLALRAALAALECELCAVFCAWAQERACIAIMAMGLECGEVRLHVPLQSVRAPSSR